MSELDPDAAIDYMRECGITSLKKANEAVYVNAEGKTIKNILEEKIQNTEGNLHDRRARSRQSQLKQRHSRHSAYQKRHRNPHTERSHNSLEHNEKGLSAAVEIADKAKQKCRKQTVNGIGFQVIRGRRNNLHIFREDRRKQISVEKAQIEQHKSGKQRGSDSV